ncbi:MAG: UTP--glucose-1-phosphate uridylyltransferase [Planctomycetes bacterium]|nr:UTP--glucose-1-phosphate uridylyltransferase [Planctomycetota bacterium]
MKKLSPDDLAFLHRFGFDDALFAAWREGVRSKRMSVANNRVTDRLLAPSADQIRDLPRQGTPERAELDRLGTEAIRRGELGVVILNGGMATRFGGVVKGVVEVFGGHSFLELKIRDAMFAAGRIGGRIPIWLMNSFATDEATKAHLAEHADFGVPAGELGCFTQFISVRMTPDGDIFQTADGKVSPHGPGHGDFAPALRTSGVLHRFLALGGKYLLLANVDNLGARISPGILGLHIQSRAEVTVEVAPKWPGDVGGSPYLHRGKLQLVEQIRYPEGFDADIVDVFNTNTFHFSADALDRDFELGWYFVEKKVDGKKAVQVERLVGEMTRFLRSTFVRVKRTGPTSRFFPIKVPDDLQSGRDEIRAMYADLFPEP